MATKLLAEDLVALKLPVVISVTVLLAAVYFLTLRKPSFARQAPSLKGGLPIVGSWEFFTRRWEFVKEASARTRSGNFSFWVGDYPIISLMGEESRRFFFESRELDFGSAYSALLGGQPSSISEPNGANRFSKRLVTLLKGPTLRNGLPYLVSDLKSAMEKLEQDPSGITQPFESIYQIVFQLTMRTVACNEIAEDAECMRKMLQYFETIESCGDRPLAIMYPRLWTPSKMRRTYNAIKLYTILNNVIADRQKTGRREEDALQFLLDQGDNTRFVVEFVIGALYAGQLNSGINGAWLVLYLSQARNRVWLDRVRAEVRAVADTHVPDPSGSVPLRERLRRVPIEAWETEFPTIDLCLKDTIRLAMQGTAFRHNMTDRALPIAETGEVVPAGTYVVYAAGDAHMNPRIYADPNTWDPARYLPDRAEDKKEQYAWWGWGVGRHPCLGMRFAKLEANLITAFWVTYFDSEVVDAAGRPTDQLPAIDRNTHTAKKPKQRSYVRYRTRAE